MSSGSNAGEKGGAPRERFSSAPAALGIALSFLLLLLVLFPEKNIIRGIEGANDLSPVVMDYQESMLRLRPGDSDLRLNLAERLGKTGQYRKALQILNGFAGTPRKEDRDRLLQARCLALYGILASKGGEAAEIRRLRDDFAATARELARNGAYPELIPDLAWKLRNIGDVENARYLMRKYVIATALSNDPASPSAGGYRVNAEAYFSAMGEARSADARRALFMKGVRSMQAGGLPVEALTAGQKHLGSLATDRDALIFMANVALAAARPNVAQYYVKKALGMES